MFTLVPQTALIAGEDGLTPQSAHTQTQLIYSIQTESISSSLLPAAQSRNMVHTSLSAPGPAEHTPVCKSALIYVSPTELKCLHELNLRPVLQVTRCQAQLTDWSVIYRWRCRTEPHLRSILGSMKLLFPHLWTTFLLREKKSLTWVSTTVFRSDFTFQASSVFSRWVHLHRQTHINATDHVMWIFAVRRYRNPLSRRTPDRFTMSCFHAPSHVYTVKPEDALRWSSCTWCAWGQCVCSRTHYTVCSVTIEQEHVTQNSVIPSVRSRQVQQCCNKPCSDLASASFS